MIQPIFMFNLNKIQLKPNREGSFKTAPLKADTFERQHPVSPSFGSGPRNLIPSETILARCKTFLETVSNASSFEDLARESSSFFIDEVPKLLRDGSDRHAGSGLQSLFRHELVNRYFGEAGCLLDADMLKLKLADKRPGVEIKPDDVFEYQKDSAKKTVEIIQDFTNDWAVLDDWAKNPETDVSGKEFLGVFNKTLLKALQTTNISLFEGSDFDHVSINNPSRLYKLLAQPILNADKHERGKSVKVVLNEVEEAGKKMYYASVITPDARPILDSKIDKIIESAGDAVANVNVPKPMGTGFGFRQIIKILRKNGHETDVSNLIEKGRERGICIRIPLIGVSNPQ